MYPSTTEATTVRHRGGTPPPLSKCYRACSSPQIKRLALLTTAALLFAAAISTAAYTLQGVGGGVPNPHGSRNASNTDDSEAPTLSPDDESLLYDNAAGTADVSISVRHTGEGDELCRICFVDAQGNRTYSSFFGANGWDGSVPPGSEAHMVDKADTDFDDEERTGPDVIATW
jgi:hypothetical protein